MIGIKVDLKGVKYVSKKSEAPGCRGCAFDSNGHFRDCLKMPCTTGASIKGERLLYPIIWVKR